MAKECMLSTGKLPLEGIPRNSMVRITDYPDLIPAVYCGHKATNQFIVCVKQQIKQTVGK